MARYIDADDLIERIEDVLSRREHRQVEVPSWLQKIIDEQPTAYNVDQVVEELSREFKPILTEKKGLLGISQLVVVGYEINTSKAIDIIRRGGVA